MHCYDTHSSGQTEDNYEKYERRYNQHSQEQQLWWKDQELLRPAFTSDACTSRSPSRTDACDNRLNISRDARVNILSETSGEVHSLHSSVIGRRGACVRTTIVEDDRAGNEGTSSGSRQRYEDSFEAKVDKFVFDHSEAINGVTNNPVGRILSYKDEAGEGGEVDTPTSRGHSHIHW